MAAMKAGSYIFVIFLLASSLVIFLSFMSELMNKNNYGMQRSWKKMRRVDKHFFFDLLPSFDLPVQNRNMYQPSEFIPHSQFTSIIDRVLLSRYLVDRFAYRSFIQFGCRLDRSIHQLLPDTTVKIRHCVDRRDGTPIAYLNASYAQNHLFDLVVADIENISESLLESYMNILDEGGTVVLTGSNNFILESNKTKETTPAEAALLHQLILMRGRQDLDLATLDADTGGLISNHASTLKYSYLPFLTSGDSLHRDLISLSIYDSFSTSLMSCRHHLCISSCRSDCYLQAKKFRLLGHSDG
jgi:hypothetical protein